MSFVVVFSIADLSLFVLSFFFFLKEFICCDGGSAQEMCTVPQGSITNPGALW